MQSWALQDGTVLVDELRNIGLFGVIARLPHRTTPSSAGHGLRARDYSAGEPDLPSLPCEAADGHRGAPDGALPPRRRVQHLR